MRRAWSGEDPEQSMPGSSFCWYKNKPQKVRHGFWDAKVRMAGPNQPTVYSPKRVGLIDRRFETQRYVMTQSRIGLPAAGIRRERRMTLGVSDLDVSVLNGTSLQVHARPTLRSSAGRRAPGLRRRR